MLATVALVATLMAQGQPAGAGPGTLASARELYAGAAYMEALEALNALKARKPPTEQLVEVEKYRAFCLLALSRTQEARQVFGAILLAQPRFRLGEQEVSRRVEEIFEEMRRQSLPDLTTRAYQRGKQAYDARDLDAAERELALVLELAADADMPADAALVKDVEVLAKGYLGLVATARQPLPGKTLSRVGLLPALPVAIFGADDEEVIPPVALRQDVPAWPTGLGRWSQTRGVVEIVIDERGLVESAVMRPALHPVYDPLLIDATKAWRYEPARRGTTAVKYRRRILITIGNESQS